ncbi:DUF58 domain-containing protein [Bifidobacterium commune]|uniref:DUF58 domain-containing protein n=1 Tax=Bifidobacterium commune TaxID=1505727 RepID=UPI0022772913|nr:DUF58 domain-containing protein [Bifidobacterium commune]
MEGPRSKIRKFRPTFENARFAGLPFKFRYRTTNLRYKLPGWLTTYISPLGWSITAIALVCLAAFPALGWHELLVCAVIGLIMLICGIVMSLGNTTFQSALSVSNDHIAVGDTVKVDVDISNPGKRPTASVIGDLPMGRAHQHFRIPRLAPGKSWDKKVEFHAMARAILPAGPLTISKGDPFGIVRHEQSLSESVNIFIHPKTILLNTLDSGVFRDLEGSPSGQVVDDDLDFYGLREYRSGDDIRNVHWLSSAKTGSLTVRQYEATKRTDTSITLSINPADYASEDEFELAISVAASIGVECLVEDRPLSTQASKDSLITHSPTFLLDWMSGIKPDPDENPNLADTTLRTSPGASFYFFIVGSGAKLERLRRIAAALSHESVCIMLRIDTLATNGIHQYDDFTLATLPSLDDLPQIMEALK